MIGACLVAVGSTSAIARPVETSSLPLDAAASFAFADDTGAVVLSPAGPGRLHARGLSRTGETRWEGDLPAGRFAIGCGPCPDVLLGTSDGSVERFDGRDATPVTTPDVPPDGDGLGPPVSAPEGEAVWAGRPEAELVELYRLADGRLAARLPLRADEERDARVALAAGGDAVALLAPMPDVLDLARRRLELAGPQGVVHGTVVEVGPPTGPGPPATSVCVGPDGLAAAATAVRGGRLEGWLLQSPAATARRLAFPSARADEASCVFDGRGPVFVTSAGGEVEAYGPGGRRLGRATAGEPRSAAVCPGAGRVVLAGDQAVVEAGRDGVRPLLDAGAAAVGCTPGGSVWILDDEGGVRWLQPR